MLRNNLAKLMIDRNITATKLFNDTGIARSTISKIANNNTDKISMSVVDTLCNYLNVTPELFFDYIPYKIDVKFVSDIYDDFADLLYNPILIPHNQFSFLINLQEHNKQSLFVFNGIFEVDIKDLSNYRFAHVTSISFLPEESDGDIEVLRSFPIQFQKEIFRTLSTTLSKDVSGEPEENDIYWYVSFDDSITF